MRKGFTLVELSIVLVIIGLLIGGILVAQSMISTAKLQSLIRTIQQYEIAVTNFETKYNGALPGDSISFGGDGDGIIYQDGHMYQNTGGVHESLNFWLNLNQAGMLSQKFKGDDFPARGYPQFDGNFEGYVPKLNYGTNCFLNAFTDISIFGNYWTITSGQPQGLDNCMTAPDAFAIDAKLDDGKTSYGSVRIMNPYSGPGPYQEGQAYYGCADNTATGYDLNGIWVVNGGPYESSRNPNRIECMLAIKAQW